METIKHHHLYAIYSVTTICIKSYIPLLSCDYFTAAHTVEKMSVTF